MKPGDAASLARYVVKRAPQYQLDANAVIVVAMQEGLLTKGGAPGDNGTSFGPWQLHKGGAYPSSAPQTPDAANAWAWSPAGVDYALSRMQSVAGGLKGRAAVRAIVYRFERPADPAKEYNAAVQSLPENDGGPKGGPGIGAIIGAVAGTAPVIGPIVGGAGAAAGAAGGVVGAAGGVLHGAEAMAAFIGKLLDPHFWLRTLEVVGGGLFVLFALYLLGRQSGIGQATTGLGRSVAMATPQGRAAAAASLGAGKAAP